MGETTQTGIPIIDCAVCGHRHPANRAHCPRCGLAHIFPCEVDLTLFELEDGVA